MATNFAQAILKVIGYVVETIFEPIEPEVTPRKRMNNSWLNLVSLYNLHSSADGIDSTYQQCFASRILFFET